MGLTILIVFLVLLIFLLAFVLVRTSMFFQPVEPVEDVELPEIDAELIAGHLASVVRVETVSEGEEIPQDAGKFRELHYALETLYPRVHATLEREIISDYSLLYTWKGSNPDLDPVLFCAHQDVVPADPGTLDQWTYKPFSGEIADGYVWGRGTLDIKVQMIGLMDAAEYLIKRSYTPERTIYLAFGQDEEIGGKNGAGKIAAELKARGVHLYAVLDEGGAIVSDTLPGLNNPVAMVGVAEKGYLSVKLKVTQTPGHSSTPPASSAIGILARAITAVEDTPMAATIEPLRSTYQTLGPAVSPALQVVFANTWLFGPFLRKKLESNPQTNASIRTTTAVTMIGGGIKDNVLPQKAEAIVNLRLMPGDSIADACEHMLEAIDDANVSLEAISDAAWEATSPSSTEELPFRQLSASIRQAFPEVDVAPYIVLGATDARYYAAICDQVFRFTPLALEKDDLSRMHGINERVAVPSLGRMTQFMVHLMKTWGASLSAEEAEEEAQAAAEKAAEEAVEAEIADEQAAA
jgi:carboxypeptidase PM20D1